ncbi:hypothetical protein LFL96_22235 [Paraburkholderia sp. D15]|uniref:hypothetical protein n=1 Tax=Paraburkholderia sp. D15 TaxID=2880218 RepID=UPI00247AAD3E|nr:hypothetical protein [Paraburkholderia sp. D15]WGS53767.1 hypothetical protein LFL96_22235 [Paraburkholderia sp. D15]
MSAQIVEGACVTLQLLGKDTSPADIANDPASGEVLREAMRVMTAHIAAGVSN